jgi:hypothetical protein
MPEDNAIISTWDNFSAGDYGKRGGERAGKGTFHAQNMLVYSDGKIGPRAGLKNITPASMPTGKLLAFVATPVAGKDGLFIIDKQPYWFDLFNTVTAPTAMAADLDQTPEQPAVVRLDTTTMLFPVRYDVSGTSTSDGTYRIDVINNTVAKLTAAPGGIDVNFLDQQVIIASSEFLPRIFGSSPTDPNSWGEGRFADVGDNWQTTALWPIRNALAILKRTGIHVLQGVLGDADTERYTKVSTSDGVLHSWESDRDADDRIWFWPTFRKLPASFDGATVRYEGHLELTQAIERDETIAATPTKRGVVVIEGHMTPSSVVFVQGGTAQRGIVQHNGIWTLHHWETSISGMLGQGGPVSQQLLATDGGGTGVAAKIFTTLLNLDRPAFTSDGLASPGDNSSTPVDAWVTLPQWWSPDGREVKVSQVIVDFTSWNTGTAATNHFDIAVRVLGRDRASEVVRATATDSEPDAFDEVVGSSSTDGTRRRKTFMFDCPPGAGIEITLSNIRGCAIRSVTAVEAKRPGRPL